MWFVRVNDKSENCPITLAEFCGMKIKGHKIKRGLCSKKVGQVFCTVSETFPSRMFYYSVLIAIRNNQNLDHFPKINGR